MHGEPKCRDASSQGKATAADLRDEASPQLRAAHAVGVVADEQRSDAHSIWKREWTTGLGDAAGEPEESWNFGRECGAEDVTGGCAGGDQRVDATAINPLMRNVRY